MKTADVIVVGLGAAGAAALYQLARRGVKAIGIDRLAPPHDQGSSHGETRITRIGVGEGAPYPPLARRSHEIWRELEAETGADLLLQCGMLMLAEPGGGSAHDRPDFLGQTISIAKQFHVKHEALTAAEIARRYPQFELRGDEKGYFEPGAGLVYPERCIAAQLDMARKLGAVTVTGERVSAIGRDGGGVRVTTDVDTYLAAEVILAAGAWAPELVGATLPAVIQPQALHWFAAERPEFYRADRFPVFIWLHGSTPNDWFYGFPIPPQPALQAVKVATESYDSIPSPEGFDRSGAEALSDEVYRHHIQGRMHGLRPGSLKSIRCLYTTTPDSDFVIDRLQDSRIILASACSGHGFKHSAAVGEMLADAAMSSDWGPPEAFRLGRFCQSR